MTPLVLLAALLLLAVGVLTLLASRRLQSASGLPRARIVYTDTGAHERAGETMFSRRHGLAGKPDYLLEDRGGIIPVEVKPTRRAASPYPGDILQLLAYCLLVEEKHGRPAYGLLRYAGNTFRIDYTDAARSHLLATVEEIRAAMLGPELSRSHNDPVRCAHCTYCTVCDEALACEE